MMSLPPQLPQIIDLFKASRSAYESYLAGGKTFRYAMELKKHNSRIMQLLTDCLPALQPQQKEDANALMAHYQAWTNKWEALAAETRPQPDDVFVFENEVTFPREAARRLQAACESL